MNVLNAACVVLVIPLCGGCATAPLASDAVRVTATPADVAGCNLLGKVIVATGPDEEKEARAQVVSFGGNVLLRKTAQVWNGNAYQCPGAH